MSKFCVLPSAGSGFIRCLHCRNPKLCLCSVTATKAAAPALVLWFPPCPTAWEGWIWFISGMWAVLGTILAAVPSCDTGAQMCGSWEDAGNPTGCGLEEHTWVGVMGPSPASHKCKQLQWSCTHWAAAKGDQCSQNHLPTLCFKRAELDKIPTGINLYSEANSAACVVLLPTSAAQPEKIAKL